jgi:hypothetical protein
MGSLAKRYARRREQRNRKSNEIGYMAALLAAVGRVNRKRRSETGDQK